MNKYQTNIYKIIKSSTLENGIKRALATGDFGIKFVNSNKLVVFFQSAKKNEISILNHKQNWITFVGKLNKAKGYDIFAKTINRILNKYPNWKAKL